jgi:hypothetical protein
MTSELAQTMALQALAWLIAEDDLRDAFLSASGASQEDLRNGVSSPVFLGSLLDFICMDDAWVTRFCDENGISNYMYPMMARQALPGGEQVNWT